MTATFDVVEVAPPMPSICRGQVPMAARRMGGHEEGEVGRWCRWMKRPLEVPALISTAGRICLVLDFVRWWDGWAIVNVCAFVLR